jgi:hypothetical protein
MKTEPLALPTPPAPVVGARLLAVLLWLLLAPTLFGATGTKPILLPSDSKAEAVKVAQNWVALLDAGKYDDSHAQAATPLKQAVSRKKWKATMGPLRDPLGAVNSRLEKSVRLTREIPGAPDAQYAVVEFATSLGNKPDVTETVTLVWEKDGRWRVASYAIR